MDPSRTHEVIDDNGNVWQRQPSGNWFVVQSATVVGVEARTEYGTPGFSYGAPGWLLISCIVLMGLIGAFGIFAS